MVKREREQHIEPERERDIKCRPLIGKKKAISVTKKLQSKRRGDLEKTVFILLSDPSS